MVVERALDPTPGDEVSQRRGRSPGAAVQTLNRRISIASTSAAISSATAVVTASIVTVGVVVAVVSLMRTAVRMRTASIEQPPSRAGISRARKLRTPAPLPGTAGNRADEDGDNDGGSNRKEDEECLHARAARTLRRALNEENCFLRSLRVLRRVG